MDKTFLFTDIEGSTRLWEQHPQAMTAALAQHNQILAGAIAAHQGHVFKTVGDGFCAVFDSPADGVQAAVAAQQQLFMQQKQSPVQLWVRMALHTGSAVTQNGDYFGPTLNRVARLMEAASGGQILLSASIKPHLAKLATTGIELRDLGEHRLRDLSDRETIFQVLAPDIPAILKPIKSLSPRPTNLPAQLTSFVGREAEIVEICRLLRRPAVRLMTLVGMGGIGKTRLALQVGANLRDEYTDGVFFINLAPISQPAAVLETIAQSLKLDESSDLLESLKIHLQDRHLLLMLDNFEHVVDAAPLVNSLLASAERLKILVTSREPLLVYGEHTVSVAPLALPDAGFLPDAAQLMQIPAVALLAARVQAVHPGFALEHAIGDAVEICRRLDGLPLAIELAAARVRDLSLSEIAAQLHARLSVLTQGPRDLSPRQQTMRGAIDWSYQLLKPDEQHLFARLGVFRGQFTQDAAEAVTGSRNLTVLRDKSLLQQSGNLFTMLDILREFALEQLVIQGAVESTRRKHAQYYHQLLHTAEPHLTGAEQAEWFNRLDNADYNLQEALGWWLEQGKSKEAAQMAAVLWRYWSTHSRLSEGLRWMERTLAQTDGVPLEIRAKVMQGAGRLALLRHDQRRAETLFQEALTLWRENDDLHGQAMTLLSLGENATQQGHYTQAEPYFGESLAIFLELDDQPGISRSLDNLGRLATRIGSLAQAEALLQESLNLARSHSSLEGLALVLNNLAEVLRSQGKYAEAAPYYRESMALYRQLDFPIGVAVMLHNLGRVSLQMGEPQQALDSFGEALRLLHDLEEQQIVAECLAGLASVYLDAGEAERAVRYLSAATALLETLGSHMDYADQIDFERVLAESRDRLEQAAWNLEWSMGKTLSLEQIITDALIGYNKL